MLGKMWWILIAEDEPEVGEMFRNAILKKIDDEGALAHVVLASDGVEALQKASVKAFDCIITDLRMPNMNGADMIRTLQEQTPCANTPVIVVSAHVHDQFQPFCSEYDHVKYVSKPCMPEDIAQITAQELNYGPRDERVSVHLMNPFLKALKSYFSKASAQKLSFEMDKAFVKPPGEQIKGDSHCLLVLTSGSSKAHFCISFEKSFFEIDGQVLDEVVTVREFGKRLAREAREMTLDLIEEAMPYLKICLGKSPRLMGLTQIPGWAKEDPNYKALEKATSITVEVRTPRGRVYLSALSKKDFPVVQSAETA